MSEKINACETSVKSADCGNMAVTPAHAAVLSVPDGRCSDGCCSLTE